MVGLPVKKSILFLLIGISLVTVNPRINGWNEASRMALTQSLVEHGTLVIDESTFTQTGDKVYINGHFYSDKPPVPSILAALVYLPLYQLGIQLDQGWNLAYYLIILFTVKFWWLISVLAFAEIMKIRAVEGQKLVNMVLIFAFASLAFTWSVTFNNHSLAASWLTIALMYYMNWKNTDSMSQLAVAGLFFGLSGSADVPTSLFLLGFAILVIHRRGLSWALLVFLFTGLVPLGIYGLINYSISGSLVPVQVVGEHFSYEGSVWGQGLQINSLWETTNYLFLTLFGAKGFIWYNPLLLLLIPALAFHIQQRQVHRAEGLVIAVSSIMILLYYSIYTQNYGGWSYSIRWFVPLLPLLYLYLSDLHRLMVDRDKVKILNWIVGTSIMISIVGLINPWSNPTYHGIPFLANLKQFVGFIL